MDSHFDPFPYIEMLAGWQKQHVYILYNLLQCEHNSTCSSLYSGPIHIQATPLLWWSWYIYCEMHTRDHKGSHTHSVMSWCHVSTRPHPQQVPAPLTVTVDFLLYTWYNICMRSCDHCPIISKVGLHVNRIVRLQLICKVHGPWRRAQWQNLIFLSVLSTHFEHETWSVGKIGYG